MEAMASGTKPIHFTALTQPLKLATEFCHELSVLKHVTITWTAPQTKNNNKKMCRSGRIVQSCLH